MTLIDISVPLENGMATWPDDPGFMVERRKNLALGDCATVSQLSMGVHTGTHVDAFNHFLHDGESLSEMDLSVYVGKTLVLEIAHPQCVTLEELQTHALAAELKQTERVLFKTKNSSTKWWQAPFNENFVHIHPDAASYLTQLNIKLVGVDYLSVEGFHSDTLYPNLPVAPTHHILMKHKVYIVEGLYLNNITEGWYKLTCLPVSIKDCDGAPARAILEAL